MCFVWVSVVFWCFFCVWLFCVVFCLVVYDDNGRLYWPAVDDVGRKFWVSMRISRGFSRQCGKRLDFGVVSSNPRKSWVILELVCLFG